MFGGEEGSVQELLTKIKLSMRETERLVKDLEHKLRNKDHIKKMSQQLNYHKHQSTFTYQDLDRLTFHDSETDSFSASNGIPHKAKNSLENSGRSNSNHHSDNHTHYHTGTVNSNHYSQNSTTHRNDHAYKHKQNQYNSHSKHTNNTHSTQPTYHTQDKTKKH